MGLAKPRGGGLSPPLAILTFGRKGWGGRQRATWCDRVCFGGKRLPAVSSIVCCCSGRRGGHHPSRAMMRATLDWEQHHRWYPPYRAVCLWGYPSTVSLADLSTPAAVPRPLRGGPPPAVGRVDATDGCVPSNPPPAIRRGRTMASASSRLAAALACSVFSPVCARPLPLEPLPPVALLKVTRRTLTGALQGSPHGDP
ncbi:hypothetical protein I4F81_009663 [Pyropia yezoensis]|uniref:Uncharacterized protein n=1 Tax=Pyropia yezoensis TaxID=2788 RepID=A0ACC3CA58_PYRYE|nr:hypothetical protein I4F81_009663 [Neopyropia yezoensis]